ncbi:amidohydrolase [bacterium]|nr:amidohydrolase [bacterium]
MKLLSSVLLIILFIHPAFSDQTRDAKFHADIDAMFGLLVETRSDFHMHPELSNQEERTGEIISDRLRALGLEVRSGVAGHGVVGLLKGGKPGPVIAVRADMDALPIQENRDVPYRSKNPGVMHACGHDVHMTVALGVAELLTKHRDELPGTVKFIFQPAEESLPADYPGDWGAKRMIREGALENPKPAAIFGLHSSASSLIDGEPLETLKLEYTEGIASANSDRFVILIKGKMAHAASPEKGVDAIVVASEAVLQLQTIRSRRTSPREPFVLTIGMMNAGRRENIIAEQAELRGTVRTLNEKVQDDVIRMMHQILKGVADSYGATYELKYRKGYPSINNDLALIQQMLPTMKRIVGKKNIAATEPGMGGEDFSYYSREIPAFFFRLGVANKAKKITAGGHTPDFDADPESFKVGVEVMSAMIWDYLEK